MSSVELFTENDDPIGISQNDRDPRRGRGLVRSSVFKYTYKLCFVDAVVYEPVADCGLQPTRFICMAYQTI